MTPPKKPEAKLTEQDKYYRELRRDRLVKMYLEGMHSVKYFEHSSVGIEMARRMNELSV